MFPNCRHLNKSIITKNVITATIKIFKKIKKVCGTEYCTTILENPHLQMH